MILAQARGLCNQSPSRAVPLGPCNNLKAVRTRRLSWQGPHQVRAAALGLVCDYQNWDSPDSPIYVSSLRGQMMKHVGKPSKTGGLLHFDELLQNILEPYLGALTSFFSPITTSFF